MDLLICHCSPLRSLYGFGRTVNIDSQHLGLYAFKTKIKLNTLKLPFHSKFSIIYICSIGISVHFCRQHEHLCCIYIAFIVYNVVHLVKKITYIYVLYIYSLPLINILFILIFRCLLLIT